MNILRITVTGYTKQQPCKNVVKTFYVRDAAEFGQRVLEWEREYDIIEWWKDNHN
jgi:hypothetical protein